MMCNTSGTVHLVRSVVEAVTIPVTVKMRLGWDDSHLSAPSFAREFEQAGVAAVIIHGRTREQGFGGRVNLDGIRAVVEAVERIPVIGNGDIRTIADAERMFMTTGCAGISIGRGALLNPGFSRSYAAGRQPASRARRGAYRARLDFMARHYHLLVGQRRRAFRLPDFSQGCRTGIAGCQARAGNFSSGWSCSKACVDFDAIVAESPAKARRRTGQTASMPEIAVPKGPIAHW